MTVDHPIDNPTISQRPQPVLSTGRQFSPSARLTLLAVILLFVWEGIGLAYLFHLPMDGWLVGQSMDSNIYTLQQRVGGQATNLQAGDQLVMIAGIPIQNFLSGKNRVDGWQVGTPLRYTVARHGTILDDTIVLENWTLSSAITAIFTQNNGLLGEILFFLVAVFTFWRRPTNAAAQSLLLLSGALVSIGVMALLSIGIPSATITSMGNILFTSAILLLYTVIAPATLIRLALVFPQPNAIVRRFSAAEAVPYLIGVVMIPLFLASDGAAGFAWTVISMMVSIGLLIYNAIHMRDAFSRAQLLWGLWGMITGLGMFLASYLVRFGVIGGLVGQMIDFLSSLSFGVIGVALSIAILRYRLWDINLILRRTLLYALLTLMLALVYFGLVITLEGAFRAVSGQDSSLAVVLSTLAIAALFSPLRKGIQNFIDRRFFRARFNAEQATAAFSAAARRQVELDILADQLKATTQEALQPEAVWVWMREPGGPGSRRIPE